MKKKLKWIILAILAIGIVGSVMGNNDEEGKDKTDTQKTEQKNEENKNDKKKQEVTYHIGDLVKVGKVEYTVNSIEAKKTIGDEYLNTDAQEMFLVINVTIKNMEDKPLTVSDSFFKLKLDKKEYNTDSGSAIYLGDANIIYKEINPDTTLTGTILFDITQDTIDNQALQLQVQTGVFGTEKDIINLH